MKECQDEQLQKHPGYLTNCLIEHRHKVTDAKCKSFLTKMSAIVFEDYRLIRGFYDHCASEVKKFKCGTISQPEEEEVWRPSSIYYCTSRFCLYLCILCNQFLFDYLQIFEALKGIQRWQEKLGSD